MSADGAVPPGADALAPPEKPAVWLWDAARGRVLWANAAAEALGAGAARAARTVRAFAAVAEAAAAEGRADAPAALDGRAGRASATPAVLPDGRLGRRVAFTPAAPSPTDASPEAAAFEAAAAPLALVDGSGALLARNAAFARAVAEDARIAAADLAGGRVSLPGRAGGAVALQARPAAPDAGGGPRWLLQAAPSASGVSLDALARIAHEFRSPLTAVLGFAEFLRAAVEDTPPERLIGYLDDLAAAAGRMRGLADDLVALGADAARRPIAEAALDAIAAETLRLVAPAARARAVTLVAPQPTGLRALVEPDALGRALANLADNAVRHGARGGRVSVAVRDLGKSAGAALEVSDDGPGLDEAGLAAALAPYERGAGATAGAGGLGLPIAREIAESHGGALEIETAPGRGLTARLRLPPSRIIRPGGPPTG